MRRMLMITAVVAIALVGCGGGGSSKSSSAAPAAAASSSGGGGANGFCGQALATNISSALAANPGDPAALQKALDALKKLESKAPSAIRADFTTIVDFYAKYVQVLSNDKSNPQKLAADLAPIQANAAALSRASQHLGSYLAGNCH
jgi:ABC-type glycerol-3-phosphate transport system substrate-binding protein